MYCTSLQSLTICKAFRFHCLVARLPYKILPSHKLDTQGSQFIFYIFFDLRVGFACFSVVECRVSALQEHDVLSFETGSDGPQNRCTNATIRLYTRHRDLSDTLEVKFLSKLRITFEHVAWS
jgi:hypothetical protein